MYDSYVTDPRYQRYFTVAWTATFALAFLLSLPAIARWFASARFRQSPLIAKFGLYEDLTRGGYQPIDRTFTSTPSPGFRVRTPRPLRAVAAAVQSIALCTLPLPRALARPFRRFSPNSASCHPVRPRAPFSLGTLAVGLLLPLFILLTVFPEARLRNNPNRFGFIALACVPPMFVLSSKSGPVQWLLGKGWTSVNFLHRWMGRIMVLLVLLHFYFWAVQVSALALS